MDVSEQLEVLQAAVVAFSAEIAQILELTHALQGCHGWSVAMVSSGLPAAVHVVQVREFIALLGV